MLKTFTKEYYLSHKGCYERSHIQALLDSNTHETIQDFLNWNIPLKDKFYSVIHYTNLTLRQKQNLALMCAKVSLKIYEEKYPNDKRVADCINATELFLEGKIDKEDLLKSRKAAMAAVAAAYTYTVANAAYTANAAVRAAAYTAKYAYNIASAANATYTVYTAAMAAVAAANTADALQSKNHTENLLNALKEFCDKAE